MEKHVCQNCSKEHAEQDLKPIKNLEQRVAPGEIMPSGECPDCGAVCHIVKTKPKMKNSETKYLNRYRHCDTEWADVWSCGCDDECPECGKAITPYESQELT